MPILVLKLSQATPRTQVV